MNVDDLELEVARDNLLLAYNLGMITCEEYEDGIKKVHRREQMEKLLDKVDAAPETAAKKPA